MNIPGLYLLLNMAIFVSQVSTPICDDAKYYLFHLGNVLKTCSSALAIVFTAINDAATTAVALLLLINTLLNWLLSSS